MFLHVDRDKARSGPHHVRATGFFGRLSLILFALAASGISIAQTCEAPALWLNPILPLAGTTCGDEQIADPLCGGVPNPGPNHVVRIFLGGQQAATLGISGGESGFDPVLYLSDAALGCARLRSAAMRRPALRQAFPVSGSTSLDCRLASTSWSSPPPPMTQRMLAEHFRSTCSEI